MLFLYIKIPVAASLPDQFHRLEDKIDQVLAKNGVGSVAGWGGSLGDALPDGSRPLAFTRVDVDVADIAAARSILQTSLPALGAPVGTEIHYTIDQRNLEDVYSESGWSLAQPDWGHR